MSHRRAYLLGHPVAHSLSPTLHNNAFRQLGVDATYEAWDVPDEDLPRAVERLRRGDCLGANVTAPHKQAALAYIDAVDAEVEAVGALNTIVNSAGRLVGTNTDATGLVRWMRSAGIDAQRRDCVVLGAGGAARASVWALARLGASSILVLNRTVGRAQDLVSALQPRVPQTRLTWDGLTRAAQPAQVSPGVIINATSPSHHDEAPVVHSGWYSRDTVAVDLVYSPLNTRFMQSARSHGARAENGLGMLMHQAALAMERWTGLEPPLSVYEDALALHVGP